MACCAFAVFIVGQVYGLFAFFQYGAGHSRVMNNSVVAWRPGEAAAAIPARSFPRARLVIAGSFAALLLALVVGQAQTGSSADAYIASMTSFCGMGPANG